MSWKKATIICVVSLLMISVIAVSFPKRKQVDNYKAIRKSMKIMKGAIKETIGYTVFNAYIPGCGIVFELTLDSEAEDLPYKKLLEEISDIIQSTVPILKIGEEEKITIVLWDTLFVEVEKEYIITLQKKDSNTPDQWEIYYHEY